MAYDEALAARVRDLLVAEEEVREKQMFGGLGFMVADHMALAVSGQGGIMVRVHPDRTEQVVATTKAEPMVMRDREVRGWVRVAPEHLRTTRQLASWVARGVERARATE